MTEKHGFKTTYLILVGSNPSKNQTNASNAYKQVTTGVFDLSTRTSKVDTFLPNVPHPDSRVVDVAKGAQRVGPEQLGLFAHSRHLLAPLGTQARHLVPAQAGQRRRGVRLLLKVRQASCSLQTPGWTGAGGAQVVGDGERLQLHEMRSTSTVHRRRSRWQIWRGTVRGVGQGGATCNLETQVNYLLLTDKQWIKQFKD